MRQEKIRLCDCGHDENNHPYDPLNSKITYPCNIKGCKCKEFYDSKFKMEGLK